MGVIIEVKEMCAVVFVSQVTTAGLKLHISYMDDFIVVCKPAG